MRWQRSSLGLKRRVVMEASTLASGWPTSQASSQGYWQSINQQIGHAEGLQKTSGFPTRAPLPLSLSLLISVSLSLSLSLSPSVCRKHTGGETRQTASKELGDSSPASQPLGHPDKQLAKPWSGQPAEQPAATRDFPLSHTLPLSLSPPVSEGIVRQWSREARRRQIG